MFTGLITDLGEILAIEPRGQLMRMRIKTNYAPDTLSVGASIACSGPCLTVVARGNDHKAGWFEVDVGAETLARTTAQHWMIGTKLNLERSLRVGDEMGGHFVTGHIDGIAVILTRENFDAMARFTLRVPMPFARFIAEKGSISLEGTSLTINSVEGADFSVLLIPHTLENTSWGMLYASDTVNFEIDLMARYAERLLQFQDVAKFAFSSSNVNERIMPETALAKSGLPDSSSAQSLFAGVALTALPPSQADDPPFMPFQGSDFGAALQHSGSVGAQIAPASQFEAPRDALSPAPSFSISPHETRPSSFDKGFGFAAEPGFTPAATLPQDTSREQAVAHDQKKPQEPFSFLSGAKGLKP